MGLPTWPWRCGLIARPVSGVEWSGQSAGDFYRFVTQQCQFPSYRHNANTVNLRQENVELAITVYTHKVLQTVSQRSAL